MNLKWLGPLALLAALFIGDQIRINRPGHKYRLTVEVDTPEGIKIGLRRPVRASRPGLQPSRPNRYEGRCRLRRSRRRQEPGRPAGAYRQDGRSRRHQLCGIARLQGRRPQPSFNDMSRMTGVVPVTGALIPVLVTFADPGDPATARNVAAGRSGSGVRQGISPARHDRRGGAERLLAARFRRPLGEPVTRGIEAKLPWLNGADNAGGDRAQGGRIAGRRAHRRQRGIHAEIASPHCGVTC